MIDYNSTREAMVMSSRRVYLMDHVHESLEPQPCYQRGQIEPFLMLKIYKSVHGKKKETWGKIVGYIYSVYSVNREIKRPQLE
jgi:hypothetical protein